MCVLHDPLAIALSWCTLEWVVPHCLFLGVISADHTVTAAYVDSQGLQHCLCVPGTYSVADVP